MSSFAVVSAAEICFSTASSTIHFNLVGGGRDPGSGAFSGSATGSLSKRYIFDYNKKYGWGRISCFVPGTEKVHESTSNNSV